MSDIRPHRRDDFAKPWAGPAPELHEVSELRIAVLADCCDLLARERIDGVLYLNGVHAPDLESPQRIAVDCRAT